MNNIYLLCLLIGVQLCAQDAHFSHYYNAPLNQNPANTGMFDGEIRGINIYRMQWVPISANPYRTLLISADAPVFKSKMSKNDFFSIGMQFINDKSGITNFTSNQYDILLGYNRSMSKEVVNRISLGFTTTYANRAIVISQATWDNQFANGYYNSQLPSGESFSGSLQKNYLDFSGGILWRFSTSELYEIKTGIAMFHFSGPDIGIDYTEILYSKYAFHASGTILLNRESSYSIEPSVEYLMQGPSKSMSSGANIRRVIQERSKYTGVYNEVAIVLGCYYRFTDAALLKGRIDYGPISAGIAYDINLSGLSPATYGRGGIEFYFCYRGALKSSNAVSVKGKK